MLINSSFLHKNKRLFTIFILLFISVTIPFTVYIAQQSQENKSHASGTPIAILGVQADNSSMRVTYQPVAGAKDYRIYDVTNPNNVKYAGLIHLIASPNCPSPTYCFSHFITQADGITPIFPFQVTGSYPNGGAGGPQVLDIPATDIDYNSAGDGQPHTLVVEAVDQLGPVPKASLYDGSNLQPNIPFVSPIPSGAMLGGNKGPTLDGKTSTNGQGPYTNNPQVLAQSQPFVVQVNPNYKAIPSKSTATQTFFDTFDNSEASTITQVSRNDDYDSFKNLGNMVYSMNAGTSKAWDIEYRQANNRDSMPFISNDHFMDTLFDGATPGNVHGAPMHTIYGSMSMSPQQTVDISNGKILHMTLEIDGHTTINRRWWDFNLSPASDPLESWDYNGYQINHNNQGLYLEFKDGKCTLNLFNGSAAVNLTTPPTKTGASISCGWNERYNPTTFSKDALGLDDKSRYDLFISTSHLAIFEDGRMITQGDIPAGDFTWSNQPLKTYFTHYIYHSDVEGSSELKTFQVNDQNFCYPLNAYLFNDPVNGTSASSNICNQTYPPGYGFSYSDERHWDNMGFEALQSTDAPTTDFSSLASLVQPPSIQAPTFIGGTPTIGATNTPIPSIAPSNSPTLTPTRTPSATPSQGPTPTAAPLGQWQNVTPANANLTSALDCGNFGTTTMVADPVRPSNLYTQFNCQGIWKSTDYGQTWIGPINTGTNGTTAGDCAGGISIGKGPAGQPPILYEACIRGQAIWQQGVGSGFWKSTDGGISWTNANIPLVSGRGDYYPPAVDPYDSNHLLLPGHEMNEIAQSTDGGISWTTVTMNPGMNQNGGTAILFFIDTGNAQTTRNTWLYMPQATDGSIGTWKTTNSGSSWTKVDNNEHGHGNAQIYQPDTNGVVYMAGLNSALGQGILRSTNYGQTWIHVGNTGPEADVFGTPNNIYADWAWACGNCTIDPNFQIAPQPGITKWTNLSTPNGMTSGPAQTATVFDGNNYIILGADWTAGLWRYVEPRSGQPLPTNSPTPTLQPTNTPIPTSTPNPQASSLRLVVKLHGLGNGGDNANPNGTGNLSPLHPNRSVSVTLFNSSNTQVAGTPFTQTLTYDSAVTKLFVSTFSVPQGITNGVYTMKISSPGFLSLTIPGVIPIQTNQLYLIPQVSLITGDINGDNSLSLLDYNMLLSKYGTTIPTGSGYDPTSADLDDNGVVDLTDINLLLREFSVQSGK